MFNLNRLACGVGAGALAMFAVGAQAQETAAPSSGPTFRLEGKVGAEYNSNVAVQDLDTQYGTGRLGGDVQRAGGSECDAGGQADAAGGL